MQFARACVLAMLGCSLGACASASDAYPDLAIRDVERAAGTLQPAEPAPYVPPAPPATVLDRLDRLDQLAAEAANAHRAFLAEAPQARSAVAAARGADAGADSWSRAQVAVAGLESSRSQAMIVLADLDRIYVDAAIEGTGLAHIAATRDLVGAQVDEQNAAIEDMQRNLR